MFSWQWRYTYNWSPDFKSRALNGILLDVVLEVCDFESTNDGTTSDRDLNPYTYARSPIVCDENDSRYPCNDSCFCSICNSLQGCDVIYGYSKKKAGK